MKVLEAEAAIAKEGLSREDWLLYRKKGIGGSDAAAIAGLHPYKSRLQVYLDKQGLLPPQPDNERMRQGRDLEEYVVRRFKEDMEEKGTPKRTKNCNYILRSTKYPFMLANVDRLIEGERAGLECKTTSVLNLRRFKNGEYPVEYYAQCVHYMAVTGAERWYLGVLILNQGYETYTIERDEEEIENLIKLEREFWEENVLKKEEPAPDGSEGDGEALFIQYPNGNAERETDLSLFDAEIERYVTLSKEIKEREKEREKIKQRVQAYMKESAYGSAGEYTVSWKNCECCRLDVSALKSELPEVYRKYLKTSEGRRFVILSSIVKQAAQR